jgi:enoyl-CoA hydratase
MAIHYEKDDDHIVLVTIDRPEAKNSADMEHFKQLREAWERFGADDDAWVAIVTGVGDAFFTGADLKRYIPEITKFQEQVEQGLARVPEGGVAEINGYRMDDGVKAVLRNVALYKPVIAAVNGFCTAGGMEMLGGVDIRIACPEAKFAVMEPKRGLFAGGGTTVRLPRQIPWPQAMEMLLCADLIPAPRAYEMGLLNAVVPREELLETAYAFARRITDNAPLAVQATKQSALEGLYSEEMQIGKVREAVKALSNVLDTVRADEPATARFAITVASEVLDGLGKELRTAFENESRISSTIFRTEDAKEGPRAFAEKRKPNWQSK